MTAEPTPSTGPLVGSQLVEFLSVLKGVDTVELKVSIQPEAHRATITGLPIDPVEAQPRQVFFFDTPELTLSQAGVVVRARRIQGGRGDTVIKLRPITPDQLPDDIRKSVGLNVEVDVIPGGFVCSASLKGRITAQEIRDAVGGTMPIRKLFSRTAREFYAQRAPAGLSLDALQPLGPTFVLKSQFMPKELQRRVVAEMWLYPDGSRLLELSTKCLPSEAFQVAAEARGYLESRGVKIGGPQQTKTRLALEFFSAERRAADAVG